MEMTAKQKKKKKARRHTEPCTGLCSTIYNSLLRGEPIDTTGLTVNESGEMNIN